MTANNPESERTSAEYGEGAAGTGSETGLDENVAGALSYLLGFITGAIFLLVESENRFVRFHAAQSIVVFGGLAVVSIVLSILSTILTGVILTGAAFGLFGLVSLLLSLFWMVVSLASLGLWLFLMFQAYQGKTTRIPIAAGIADGLV